MNCLIEKMKEKKLLLLLVLLLVLIIGIIVAVNRHEDENSKEVVTELTEQTKLDEEFVEELVEDTTVDHVEETKETDIEDETKTEESNDDEIISESENMKPESTSTSGGVSSSTSSNTPSHTCNFNIPIYEDVPEKGHTETVVITAAYVESVPIVESVCYSICNACGEDITGKTTEHMKAHMLAGEGASYRAEYENVTTGYNEVEHPAVTEDVYIVDTPATTKVIGYMCTCGTSK